MSNPDLELGVRFFVKSVENLRKTKDQKRPIYDDLEYIEISFPADNKRRLVAPADEMHYVQHAREQMTYAQRFREAYEAFKANDENFVSGTPLRSTGLIPQAKCEELKAQGVVTVEQLAGLPHTVIKTMGMGTREMVEEAKKYLEGADARAEVEALKRQIAELQAGSSKTAPVVDAYEGFEDDDLKNMIKDAGGKVARGASRADLLAALEEITSKEDA